MIIASDQGYRETDLAIDFCEDVNPLGKDQIDKICRIFKNHGATYKVSSIHVNGWFGNYSKIEMTKTMVSRLWGINLDEEKDRYVFCGDSPNDEPMFEYFPISIGVNNVLNFEDQLKVKPGSA
jgi:hydroxymethylpyrimidine pyrophosphatase-like HAD family hydrolase